MVRQVIFILHAATTTELNIVHYGFTEPYADNLLEFSLSVCFLQKAAALCSQGGNFNSRRALLALSFHKVRQGPR